MSASIADLYVVLDSVTDPFSASLKKAAADAEGSTGKITSVLGTIAKVGVGAGVAVAGIAVESIKMASTFNAQMTLLNTQAGVSKNQIGSLSNGVLALAGQVGFAPTSLAEALFHIESSFASVGITGPKAMELLRVSAEGAAVGHANLVDVTNALDAAVVSGIPGVQNLNEAMGQLNATVGSGDMTMQDLADAFSTGLLANVKSYGLTFTDVGAALAVFGDNNIRGQNAATDLRMAVQALAVPAKSAAADLDKMGLSSSSFADVMSKKGLLPALQLLHDKMDAIGVTAQTQGEFLTQMFGKKAGAGIVVLYDQLDRLKSKYPELTGSANNFQAAWETTKNTFSQQVKEIESGADALAIHLGQALIPKVSAALTAGQSIIGQIASGFTGAATAPVQHPNMGNARLNELAAKPPDPTGWQKFGEQVHSALTTVIADAKKLEPVGQDILRFGEDAFQAGEKIVQVAAPIAQSLGTDVFHAARTVADVFANDVGPVIKDFANFLADHQELVKIFAEVVLGGLIAKMTILGTLNAAKGVIGIADAIVRFPLGQAGEIATAFKAMKTAFTGAEAAEGEQAVAGLAGSFGKLKDAVGGFLDKFSMFNGAKLSGLAQASNEMGAITTEAEKAGQLSLFETHMSGIVQVAEQGPQQLSLFEAGMSGVEGEAEKTTGSVGKLGAGLGKLAIPVAVIVGAGLLGDYLGKLAGVGDHTGGMLDKLNTSLQNAAMGSSAARSQFEQVAEGMVTMSNVTHHSVQGLQDSDSALAQLVQSGQITAAKQMFQDITDTLGKQGVNAQDVARDFPQYQNAIKNAGDAAQTADGQVSSLLGIMDRQQSMDQFRSDINNLSDSLKSNGTVLTGNSQAAIANRNAFSAAAEDIGRFYQQQRDAHVPIGQATKDLQLQVDQLEQAGIQAGFTKGDVDSYLKTLNLIPSSIGTTITADTGMAYRQVGSLMNWINSQTGEVTIGTTGPGKYAVKANAQGGPVKRGDISVVGEDGPEILQFGADGFITPNNMIPKALLANGSSATGYVGGGSTVVNNYYSVVVQGSVTTEKKLVDVVRTQVLQYKGRNSSNGL